MLFWLHTGDNILSAGYEAAGFRIAWCSTNLNGVNVVRRWAAGGTSLARPPPT